MAIETRWNYAKRGQSKYSEKNLSQSQFSPHKFHSVYSGTELVPPRQEGGEYLPESSYSVATEWSDSRSKKLNPNGIYMLQFD
jgi:hypothetical protein